MVGLAMHGFFFIISRMVRGWPEGFVLGGVITKFDVEDTVGFWGVCGFCSSRVVVFLVHGRSKRRKENKNGT